MKLIIAIYFLLFSVFLNAQLPTKQKHLEAIRITEQITIDGDLNEATWRNAPIATDFITYDPVNGNPASEKTEVKVLYDNYAIYIGATLYDREPQKILTEYSRRDLTNINADNFRVAINPYADGQNTFNFMVTSVNVQTDFKETSNLTDYTWNAVWESEVKITESGMNVEIKIPYSALRFPNTPIQNWDINFWRLIRRIRENSSWNFVNKQLGVTGIQSGKLHGIKNIISPVRLAFFPYISAYAQHNSDGNSMAYSLNGGMDIKYGINESFTLDATLIPDFGQTKSDDKILNLTPFEIKYNENRQFFMEGTELFNKAGLFYSRRIGNTPSGYYAIDSVVTKKGKIVENPAESRLINATKISGRNNNNLGLGFFNAMTSNTYASVEDSLGNKSHILTEPFTNYNIIVADQSFNKNSYVNIINTNVYQSVTQKFSDVIGSAFRIYDDDNLYAFHGYSALSIKRDGNSKESSIGEYYNLNVGKLNGNVYFNYGINLLTDKFDPNDMGYLAINNDFSQVASFSYRIFQPFRKFLYLACNFNISYNELYKPRKFTSTSANLNLDATFKNYTSISLGYNQHLKGEHDYYESRVPGKVYIKPKYETVFFYLSSDYRKPFAIDITLSEFASEAENYGYNATLAPRIRVNNHFLFTYTIAVANDLSDIGYASKINNDSIVFGKRNNRNITNSFSGTYVFNNKSYLSLNLRHYWSKVDYLQFFLLNKEGALDNYPSNSMNQDINFNAFALDMTYTWNFAPGSFINILWKNNITKNDKIFDKQFDGFFENFNKTINSPQINSISVKLSYYIDYLYLAKKQKI